MEPALCHNLNLKPTHCSPISTELPKPISRSSHSHRLSCLNRQRSENWSALIMPCASYKPKSEALGTQLIGPLVKGLFGFAAAATTLVSVCCDSPALAQPLTVAFPVSRAREVNTVQRTLVEAWGLIRETFIDPSFNHQDWLHETMVELFPLRSADAAYTKISGMLSTLGDPFTRIISPEEYQSFRIGSDGNLQGVGLLINAEPRTGHLRKDLASDSGVREVKLPREYIKLSPISSTIIPHRTGDGRLTKIGYVKLSAFSQTAAADMKNALHEMESQNVQAYILDLRNNPGGLLKAGLDIAQIWLDGDETLVNTIDRDGNMSPINMVNGHAITHDPLVVLVNEGSASASEILAGALHDNGRAMLVGHKTFGKGKIQSVTELHDGSALFVTVAKYLSPALHDIDQVGITPDVQCTTEMLNSPKDSFLRDKSSVVNLEADSCIMVAEHELDIQQSKGTAS
ncbi:carboxyl-terminal-processing peptidase 3, chloroplastic-like isoform X2 [Juglans regia]|uniref:C-terminal processing peptidase n=1 Tax=Juglans regia TaxID=51240 RepID=A0A6P9ERX8_JUGRE|nr:carboxyl-terminal-processing peptidase 3, chloroplastic-like isoform X2 [Juglans regia]